MPRLTSIGIIGSTIFASTSYLSDKAADISHGLGPHHQKLQTFLPKYTPASQVRFSNWKPDGLKTYVHSPSKAVLLFSVLCLIFHVLYTLYIRHCHLAKIPGPFWAPYTRLWLSKTLASGDSARIWVDINQKYGPIARIGPNNLLTDDPAVTRSILAARSHYARGPWYDSIKIDPHVPNIVSERHAGKHNHLRHQMSAGYTGKEIEGTEQCIDARILDFMS